MKYKYCLNEKKSEISTNCYKCTTVVPEDFQIQMQYQLVLDTSDYPKIDNNVFGCPDNWVFEFTSDDKFIVRLKQEAEKLDIFKDQKIKELESYLNNADSAGYVTTLGIKSDCTENSISKLNLGLSNYNLISTKDTDKVNFCDFYNDLHSITFLQFKQICKEVGADYSNRYGKKWTVRKAINEAKTIEEIQAIVI